MTWMPSLNVLARYLIASVVASHGITYTMYAALNGQTLAGWRGSSWLLGSVATANTLKTLTLALWVMAGVGFIAAGIAIAFPSSFQGFWPPLAIGASLVGLLSFAALWDGQVQLLARQGFIGAVLSLIILICAIVLP